MAHANGPNTDAAPQLDALNGMRFFAVFHIFLFHIWSTRVKVPRDAGGKFANAYTNLEDFPRWLNNLLAHGYLSTSFFFLLSGFILAYLYWMPGGGLSTTRGRFWWQRFTRIYPVHFIVLLLSTLLTLTLWWFDPTSAPPVPLAVASALATATLTQAWYAPLVPIWSWPTWALSAVVFLYLIMPWLVGVLARLSRKQAVNLLVAMPVISLVPTLVFLQFFPDSAKDSQNWQIFIGSTPLFWVPHFVAGMLMSRIFRISRFEQGWRENPKPWISLGDFALIAVIALCLMEPHDRAWRHILRHGALMPFYMLVLYDLALGRGLVARVFSLPGMGFLGQTSFSIFIWQNLFLGLVFGMAIAVPGSRQFLFWFAVIGVTIIAMISTYWIEKPIARRLRRHDVPGAAAPRTVPVQGDAVS
jgi:peptidoglycan/LPS O-acetylase OafA/YrhL